MKEELFCNLKLKAREGRLIRSKRSQQEGLNEGFAVFT